MNEGETLCAVDGLADAELSREVDELVFVKLDPLIMLPV